MTYMNDTEIERKYGFTAQVSASLAPLINETSKRGVIIAKPENGGLKITAVYYPPTPDFKENV